jgi:hypothetical protein
MCALADDTNVNSAMVSYSYIEDFTSGSILSPFVSFQYQESRDALLASGPIASPMVSYQYFEWAGDVLPLVWRTSPQVSYFYLSWSTPPASLSSSSVVTVSPSSVPADGSTPATVTVTLLDGNRNPVAGKAIIISAVQQATSGLVARLATITQPANPTDDSGQTTATLTSSTPGTVIISAQDATDSISLSSQPRVQFTPAFLPPTKVLNDAIVSLTSEASYDLSPYIGNVALHEGQCGDYFQNQANTDRAEKAAIVINAGLGFLLALVPLDEVLLPTGSALDRAFLNANISLMSDYNALGIGKLVEDIAGSSTGLSLEGQDIGSYSATRQGALLQAEQDLLAGVPPASVSLTAAFINDLALRQQANQTIKLLLINQDGLLSEMQSDSEFSHTDFLTPLFTTVDVIGSVFGGIAGGPLGGIAVNETIIAVESGGKGVRP